MNPNAQKWVEALRSGNYAQAKSYLRSERGYCCHGVGCTLFAEKTGNGYWDNRYRFVVDNVHFNSMPHNSVLEWLGIDQPFAEHLADMNDWGCSFEEIADCIEAWFASGECE